MNRFTEVRGCTISLAPVSTKVPEPIRPPTVDELLALMLRGYGDGEARWLR